MIVKRSVVVPIMRKLLLTACIGLQSRLKIGNCDVLKFLVIKTQLNSFS
jgi:hypothetical protein